MYVLYYTSMFRCWYLVWILVRTDHPYLGVGCHSHNRMRDDLGEGGQRMRGLRSPAQRGGGAGGAASVRLTT
jgi:hypothetical protein